LLGTSERGRGRCRGGVREGPGNYDVWFAAWRLWCRDEREKKRAAGKYKRGVPVIKGGEEATGVCRESKLGTAV